MSNELSNWHAEQGCPFGDDLGVYELADEVGNLLSLHKINFSELFAEHCVETVKAQLDISNNTIEKWRRKYELLEIQYRNEVGDI
jgi:hypothetical protein